MNITARSPRHLYTYAALIVCICQAVASQESAARPISEEHRGHLEVALRGPLVHSRPIPIEVFEQ